MASPGGSPGSSGLHTGPGEVRDRDFYGPTVNRAARVTAAAYRIPGAREHAHVPDRRQKERSVSRFIRYPDRRFALLILALGFTIARVAR